MADRNAVQTISRLNRCHPDKEGVVVVDFTNNARAILKAFNKYRHGSPHDPDEPDAQKCIELYDEIIAKGVFTQADAGAVVELIKKNKGGTLETRVNELRIHFNTVMTDAEERKAFVYLLAKFVKSFHFLSAFFSYEKPITEFAAFCEYVGPQLIKAGSVSDLMKQLRATVVEKAAVTDEGVVTMPTGLTKPKPSKGGGGGGAPIKKISVQDMIAKIREEFQITEEEALHIREVSEEKIADESVQQTVAAHRADLSFLDTVFREQVNGGKVATCTSTDATRHVLNGVLFSPENGGILIATDGKRLAGAPAKVPCREFVLPNAAARVLCHPDFLVRDAAIIQPAATAKPADPSDPRIQFRSGPLTFIVKTIEDRYPNYKQVIPAHAPEVVISARYQSSDHDLQGVSWRRQ